jgi:hypothetical protein
MRTVPRELLAPARRPAQEQGPMSIPYKAYATRFWCYILARRAAGNGEPAGNS